MSESEEFFGQREVTVYDLILATEGIRKCLEQGVPMKNLMGVVRRDTNQEMKDYMLSEINRIYPQS